MILEKGNTVRFPTKFGEFKLIPYTYDEKCHVVLAIGDLKDNSLVRLHSECLTGEALHSLRCDCGEQLERAMQMIAKEGSGAIVYLRQEGRGIGLANKLKAYALQDKGMDTVEANHQLGFRADERDYSVAIAILKDLGLKKIRLLTNNPDKIEKLNGSIDVVERVPLVVEANEHNRIYLDTKRERMGHGI